MASCAVEKDFFNECYQKMKDVDGILLGSPTYFADVSSSMRALIERAGFVSRANNYLLKGKAGAGVVAVRRAGSIQALTSLNLFFLYNQMVVPGSSYWNMAVGMNPGDVQNDAEGMQTMVGSGKEHGLADEQAEGLTKRIRRQCGRTFDSIARPHGSQEVSTSRRSGS